MDNKFITDDQLVSEIKDKFEKSVRQKYYVTAENLLNSNFIRGNQNLYMDVTNKYINTLQDLQGNETAKSFNFMGPIRNIRVKILTSVQPNIKVLPQKKQRMYIQKTKLTNELIRKLNKDINIVEKYDKLVQYIEDYRYAFIKVYHDVNMGNLIKYNAKRIEDEKSNNAYTILQKINKGKVNMYIGNINELYLANIKITDIQNQPYIIHAKAFHIDDIKKAYGLQITQEDIDAITKQPTKATNTFYRNDDETNTHTKLENHAMVYEFYEKPTYNSPMGRYVLMAGNKIIINRGLPYKVGENSQFAYNFVDGKQLPQSDHAYGWSLYNDLRPVQREYNKTRNNISYYNSRVAIGQMLVPHGSLEDTEDLNNELGNIIVYNSAMGAPKYLTSDNLPTDVWNTLAQCEKEASKISGISQFAISGELPSGIRSGKQQESLAQQDESAVGLTAKQLINMMVNAYKMALRLLKQKGELFPVEIFKSGIDAYLMKPEEILEDIYVENASIIGLTESEKTQRLIALANMGALNKQGENQFGPQNSIVLVKEMGMEHLIGEIDNPSQEHIEYANRENNRMIFQLMQENINDYDDDEIHIAEHEKMFLSEEYEKYIEKNTDGDRIHENMINHYNQHIQRKQQTQQSENIMQMMMKNQA